MTVEAGSRRPGGQAAADEGARQPRATAARRRGWYLVVVACVAGCLAGGGCGTAESILPGRPTAASVKPLPVGGKGVASARLLRSDPGALSKLGATWAYNWSATPPPAGRGPQWVPMVWGAGTVTAHTMSALAQDARDGRARYLLGFNEPDSPTQSNLTVQQAADLWPALERTGLILGSPAPAYPGDGWLPRFMALVRSRHLRVDFIALHEYQDFTNPTAIDTLRRELIAVHREFGRPIWITEVGTLDIRVFGDHMEHPPSEGLAVAYMHRVSKLLGSLSFVQRYAWFTDVCGGNASCRYTALRSGLGGETDLGRAFASAP